MAGHGGRPEQRVHDAEERQLQQQGQAPGQHPACLPLIERGQFALLPVRLPGMPLAQGLGLRGYAGLAGLAAHRVEGEREQQQPHGDREQDNRRRGGQAPSDRREQLNKGGDDVIGGANGGAEDRKHDGDLQRFRHEWVAGDGR